MSAKTVLLIEHADADRQVHAEMLRFVGFRVLDAADVADGIREAGREPPDLIFLDLPGPAIDWRPLGRLREAPATRAVPVAALVTTALDEADLAEAGLCGQIERPLRPFRLVEEAERCIGAADASLQSPEQLRAHGLHHW